MKKKWVLAALVAVVALGGLAWALMPAGSDPQVARVAELQEKLFSENSQVPREGRRKAFEEFRTEMEKLTPEQRDQLMRDHPPQFARQMEKNIVAFFDLSDNERKAALDKQIDDMEKRRREWEKRRGERGSGRGGGPGAGGPPRGFGGRNMDPAKQNEMRKRMLDNTSPQQRAMFGEYFRQLQDRRRERGLPEMRGDGRRPL